jgi:hypothetical protein
MLSRTRIALFCAAAALAVSPPTLRNGFAIDDIYVLLNDNYISPKATTISPHPEGRR